MGGHGRWYGGEVNLVGEWGEVEWKGMARDEE
jgi:hypothetical protein